MMWRSLLLLWLLWVSASTLQAQPSWTLAKDHDGIKVFLKNTEGTGLKMLRVECELDGTVDAVLALLLDLPAVEKWIPQTKTWRYLRRMSPAEFLYYSELRMPWPVWNRDFVIHLRTTQNPVTKVVTLDAKAVPGELPPKEGIVRIDVSTVKWVLYPLPKDRCKLVYELFTDPGGSLPVSVVNYFARQAAFGIVKKMRQMVREPPYRDAKLSFLAR